MIFLVILDFNMRVNFFHKFFVDTNILSIYFILVILSVFYALSPFSKLTQVLLAGEYNIWKKEREIAH